MWWKWMLKAFFLLVSVSGSTGENLESNFNVSLIGEAQILQSPYPYYFPRLEKAGTTDLFPVPLCNGFKLEEATVDELQHAMATGVLTSVKLVTCYLQRIYQVDNYIRWVYLCFVIKPPEQLTRLGLLWK
jgi:amidase